MVKHSKYSTKTLCFTVVNHSKFTVVNHSNFWLGEYECSLGIMLFVIGRFGDV